MTKTPLFPITLLVSILIFILISGCGHSSVNNANINQPPTLLSLVVTPGARSMPLGGAPQYFAVTGSYADGSRKTIPANSVTWNSSNTGVMSISPGGLATPITQGTTTISAAYGGMTVSFAITVTPYIAFTSWSTASNPVGVAVDASGSVYVATAAFSNNSSMINKYSAPGSKPTPFNASVTSSAAGVAVDASGNVYVTDYDNNQLNIYNAAGALTTYWATPAPSGVAVNSALGIIYVTDAKNNLLYKYNSSGSLLQSWSTTGVPSGVAVDSSGNAYVADISNSMIRIFSSAGTALTPWATTGTPFGVAVNAAGTKVYVIDSYNYLLREYDSSGNLNPGGPWSTIGWPNAVAVDQSGNVYVLDSTNNTVREYQLP